ncbi:MAG: thiol-activated cytolysin family protein [Bacteroidota bacterium]
MKKFAIRFLTFISIFILSITSCKKEAPIDNLGENPTGQTFAEVIATGGNFSQPTVNTSTDTTEVQNNLPISNGTFNCTTVTYSVDAAGGGDSGFPLFNPGADVIYPGSMLQGNSLHKATPNPIVVERAGGTISTNILDGNLQSFFEVDEVTKSSITNGMNNIIANSNGSIPSNFDMTVVNIQSREQFALALGLDVNTAFVDVESKFNYSSETEKSSFLVSLNQEYYTMTFDLPTSLDKLFAPSVTPEQLANYVGESNPATYISSVTYGRIFYMLIESTSSETELRVAIDGAFSGVVADVDAELEIDYFSSLDNVTYSVFAYGREAGPTFELVGETNMEKLRNGLKESTSLGSGKPLSYVVRNVKDNQIVATQLATQYDVVECEQISNVGTLPAIVHWTGHPAIAELGPITAAYANSDDHFILINEQGDWVRSTINGQGEGVLEGPFPWGDDLPFSTVGATCRLEGPGEKLYVFNGLGNKYASLDASGNWGQVFDIGDYLNGDCPFINVGVGALAYAGTTIASWGPSHYMFNKPGTHNTYASWQPVHQGGTSHFAEVWEADDSFEIQGKINGVGASIGFQNGAGHYVYILFNLAGTEYGVWGDFGTGTGGEFRGPFSL